MDPALNIKEAAPSFLGAAATLLLVLAGGLVKRWTQSREAPAVDPVLVLQAEVSRLKRDVVELRRLDELSKAKQHAMLAALDEATRQRILELQSKVQRDHEERWQVRDDAGRGS